VCEEELEGIGSQGCLSWGYKVTRMVSSRAWHTWEAFSKYCYLFSLSPLTPIEEQMEVLCLVYCRILRTSNTTVAQKYLLSEYMKT
jgi:hypothetical protein